MEKKRCSTCKKLLDKLKFSKNLARKDGLQTICKKCKGASDKLYYAENKEKFAEYRKQHRREISEFVSSIKVKCEKCGEEHPATLHFHHKDPSKKELNIGNFRQRGWGIPRLRSEIEKCQVLCANCHAKLHWG